MRYWDPFIGKNGPLAFNGKARLAKIRRYSPEVEGELITRVQRMTQEMLAGLKRNQHPDRWPELVERCRGIEQMRIAQIRLFFFQKRGF